MSLEIQYIGPFKLLVAQNKLFENVTFKLRGRVQSGRLYFHSSLSLPARQAFHVLSLHLTNQIITTTAISQSRLSLSAVHRGIQNPKELG